MHVCCLTLTSLAFSAGKGQVFSAFTPPFLRRAWLHTLTRMDDQNQTFVCSGFREPCGHSKQELFALYSCPAISLKAKTPLVCEAQNIHISVFCARKYCPWVFILPEIIKWNRSICCKEFCEIVHSSWSEDCWRGCDVEMGGRVGSWSVIYHHPNIWPPNKYYGKNMKLQLSLDRDGWFRFWLFFFSCFLLKDELLKVWLVVCQFSDNVHLLQSVISLLAYGSNLTPSLKGVTNRIIKMRK